MSLDDPPVRPPNRLHGPLVVIAAATVASGATQMLAPGFVLRLFESPDTRAGRQFFGTVGMFMTIVGGSLLQRLVTGDADPDELWWAAVQKFGASAAVGLGIRRKVFSRRAIPVATFDLVSGLACLAHRRRLLNGASGPGR